VLIGVMELSNPVYPPKLLELITPWLKAKHIARLYLTGSTHVQRLLRHHNVVQTLIFDNDECTRMANHKSAIFLNETERFPSVTSMIIKHERQRCDLFDKDKINNYIKCMIDVIGRIAQLYGKSLTYLNIDMCCLDFILLNLAKADAPASEVRYLWFDEVFPLFSNLVKCRLNNTTRSCDESVLTADIFKRVFAIENITSFDTNEIRIDPPLIIKNAYHRCERFTGIENTPITEEDKPRIQEAFSTPTNLVLIGQTLEYSAQVVEAINLKEIESLAICTSISTDILDQPVSILTQPFIKQVTDLPLASNLTTLELGFEQYPNHMSETITNIVSSILNNLPPSIIHLGLPTHAIVSVVSKAKQPCLLPPKLQTLGFCKLGGHVFTESMEKISRNALDQSTMDVMRFWKALPQNLVQLGSSYWVYFPFMNATCLGNDIIKLPSGIQNVDILYNELLLSHLPTECRTLTIYHSYSPGILYAGIPWYTPPAITDANLHLPKQLSTNHSHLTVLTLKLSSIGLEVILQDLFTYEWPTLLALEVDVWNHNKENNLSCITASTNLKLKAPKLECLDIRIDDNNTLPSEFKNMNLLSELHNLKTLIFYIHNWTVNADDFFRHLPSNVLRKIAFICADFTMYHLETALKYVKSCRKFNTRCTVTPEQKRVFEDSVTILQKNMSGKVKIRIDYDNACAMDILNDDGLQLVDDIIHALEPEPIVVRRPEFESWRIMSKYLLLYGLIVCIAYMIVFW
jgi:hypothetical protein